MRFLYSFFYLLSVAVTLFFLGRIYPKKWLRAGSFPFKSFKFEKNGDIYNKIKIMSWKTKLPDVSLLVNKIMPTFMPKKRLDNENQISVLIEETCIAELVHVLASILGFGCVFIWKGVGGWIMSLLFLFGNLPFIIMQRFNRPRLIKAEARIKGRCSCIPITVCQSTEAREKAINSTLLE